MCLENINSRTLPPGGKLSAKQTDEGARQQAAYFRKSPLAASTSVRAALMATATATVHQ